MGYLVLKLFIRFQAAGYLKLEKKNISDCAKSDLPSSPIPPSRAMW